MLKIYIEVDTNDGDYVGDLKDISEKDVTRLSELVKKSGDNLSSWEEGECADSEPEDVYPDFTEDEIEFISDFMPNVEYGFHTLIGIKILKEEKVLV